MSVLLIQTSSKPITWPSGTIKCRAEYCGAQVTVVSEVSDIKASCKESEVSIFLLFDYQLLARAPPSYLKFTRVCFDFQMDLATKFKIISACQQTKITSLKIDLAYPIEHAERVQTKYGKAILITLQAETPQTFLKVFLPRRYGTIHRRPYTWHQWKENSTQP